MLHDNSAQGHALTDKQRRYFGAVASGYASGTGPRRKRARGRRR